MLYDGKPYAVGILWFTAQEDSGKGLLQQRIKKTKSDFYCLRNHIAMQQGFGWLSKGHRRGMKSAAAMVADQLVGEWHGVFEADNGWWYAQVRSDTITPNGDIFFTSEEEAYRHFQEESQKNVWPHAYAPEKWHIVDPNTRELPLKNLLDDLSLTTLVPTNLTAVFGSKSVRNIVVGGLLAAFFAMLVIMLVSMFGADDEIVAAQNRAPLRTVSGNKAAAQTQAPKKLEAPKAQPNEAVSPQQLLQQCGDAAAKLYVSIPGWVPQVFTCSLGKAAMSWQQTTGLLSDAKDIGNKKWPQGVAVTFANRLMTAGLSMGSLPRVERTELFTQEMALLYLEQKMQPMGAITVKTITPPAPVQPRTNNNSFMSGNTPAPAPQPAPPPYLEISLQSGFDPNKISELLLGPAFELKQVQWRIQQGLWVYQLKWTFQNAVRTNPNAAAKPVANNAQTPSAAPQAAPTGGQK